MNSDMGYSIHSAMLKMSSSSIALSHILGICIHYLYIGKYEPLDVTSYVGYLVLT